MELKEIAKNLNRIIAEGRGSGVIDGPTIALRATFAKIRELAKELEAEATPPVCATEVANLNKDVLLELTHIIAVHAHIKPIKVNAHSEIATLGLDSLAMVVLSVAIEEEFKCQIVDETFMACKTVQDMTDLIASLMINKKVCFL